jgi:iron uptake system EfeUOB component EfeO/EfeM
MIPASPRSGRLLRIGTIVVAAGIAVTAVAVALVQAGTAGANNPQPVTVNGFSCAGSWTPPHSGQREITIVNAGSSVVDVTLLGAKDSLVYGEVEAMAPGITRAMTAVIPPGKYRLGCTYSENATVYSAVVTVSGSPVHDAHPYEQVTYNQMAPLVTTYRADVASGLAVLATDTDHLQALVVSGGQPGQIEQAWLVAHLDYARLGAAYDTFGDFNDEIDGRPNGLPQGVNDPSWTGFLRVEYALWHGQSAATVTAAVDQLDTYVHQLVLAFPEQTTPPNDLSLRTHEILENTLQFELTGETDQGSHTGLATAAANVQGTEMTLGALAPLLQQRDPALLAATTNDLHGLATLIDSYRSPAGAWTPVQSLAQAQREDLDGAIGNYLETVSPLPDLLELTPEASSP